MNSQHMLPEKFTNHLYATNTSRPLNTYSGPLHNPRKTVSLIRTVWIRHNQQNRAETKLTKSDQLIRKFSEDGLDIWILNTSNLSFDEIACFDFVFLEYQGGSNKSIENALLQLQKQLPQGRAAPLVILADESQTEQAVDLIEAGADELFLASMDNEVILARCRALLRRCYQVL